MLRIVCLLLLALLTAGPVPAGDTGHAGWNLIKEDGPVRVYTQPARPGRPMGIRGVSRAAVRFEELAAVLLDVPSYPAWMKELREARIIETVSPDTFLLYNYYDLSWPFADRDVYVRVRIEKDIPHGLARAYITRDEDPRRPPVNGVVRIPAMEGILEIRYVTRDTTEGIFTEWFDMGGDVPEWLKNFFARNTPAAVLELVGEACRTPETRQRGARSPLRKEIEQAVTDGMLRP